MKNYFKYTLLLLLMGGVLGLSSCEKWLDVSPKSNIKGDDLLQDQTGFRDILIGVYASMATTDLYGANMTYQAMDVLAQYYDNPLSDEIDFESSYRDLAEYNYTDETVRPTIDAMWSKAYSSVVNLNYGLKYIDKKRSAFESQQVFDVCKGEMLALRAFLQFDMLRLFAPSPIMNNGQGLKSNAIPYVTEYTIETQQQLTVEEHLSMVVKDLQEARKLMQYQDPFGPISDTLDVSLVLPDMLTNRDTRMNYYATSATLARVYAYAGYKDEAYATATELIDEINANSSRLLSLTDDTNKDQNPLFTNETVFMLKVSWLDEYQEGIFNSELAPWGTLSLAIQDNPNAIARGTALYSAVGADYRKPVHILDKQEAGADFVKYDEQESISLLRLSELYLIAAEYAPSTDKALEYFNTIIAHRGLNALPAEHDFFTELYKEIRREFFGDGQLFYFYKRHCDKFENIGVEDNVEIESPESAFVFPLPITEQDFGEYK